MSDHSCFLASSLTRFLTVCRNRIVPPVRTVGSLAGVADQLILSRGRLTDGQHLPTSSLKLTPFVRRHSIVFLLRVVRESHDQICPDGTT